MSKIVLGQTEHGQAVLDLPLLLRTRLLIQANSGGGKSWLLRRLAEQFFGKIPVLIIDPEGEFATLREKFGYVLVGKGGETPADPRSAALVAHKLLELRASAVCDLYEMKPHERHHWVKLFLEALIDAPKNLWRPTIIMVDEAHTFCPEKGAGESEASDAMTSLPTRGRKRRFCSIWATQRLGKLRKDASAELLNRLVGPTFEDVDLKRAAELLSIPSEGRREFDQQMRVLEPGTFFALGRAISKERLLVRIGSVETSHEVEEAHPGAGPPPLPEKIKALLPKLADLPKEAEEKARTEAELRTEIRSLKAHLRAQPKPAEPIVDRTGIRELEAKLRETQKTLRRKDALIEKVRASAAALAEQASASLSEAGSLLDRMTVKQPHTEAIRQIRLPQAQVPRPALPVAPRPPKLAESNGNLTGPEQRILDAVAWLQALGQEAPNQVAVAFLARYAYGGGAFNNPKGALRTKGLVEYVSGDRIKLTEQGISRAAWPQDNLTAEELQSRVMNKLPGPEQRILNVLLASYPESVSKEDCARRCDPPYEPGGGAFNNPCGRLRSLGLVDYPEPGKVRALPLLFLE